MIDTIEPRRHELARLAPTARGTYRQIIIANAPLRSPRLPPCREA